MYINWDAVGAVGQWAGAVFAALAIYFAVKKDKPKISLSALFRPDTAGGRIEIYAINQGYIPTTITRLIVRNHKDYKNIDSNLFANVYLEAGKQVLVTEGLRWQTFREKNLERDNICFLISVVDHFGNEYFLRNNLKSKIKRFWLTKFKNN